MKRKRFAKRLMAWTAALAMLPGVVPASAQSEALGTIQLRLSIGTQTMSVRLEDSSASQSLLEQLPLTLTFEDYNQTEKIAYPPDALDVSSVPDGCDPEVGTLAYYKPWGNLCIFYREFRASTDLVPLGMIESDMRVIQNMQGNFEIALEALDEASSGDAVPDR